MSAERSARARLAAMGVVAWRLRDGRAVGPPACPEPEPAVTGRSQATGVTRDTAVLAATGDVPAALETLRASVAACTRCALHASRTQTVFGVGDPHARLLVVGEAPGADEDAQGEPFVGRAGRLLNAMLAGIGLAREQVYICNILKCRPPRNRDPAVEEVASCAGYLQRQIELVAPELILALGRVAAQNLLDVSTPIGKLRGREHAHPGTATPVLVTYHPAYLLRSPLEKRRAWEDLKRVAAMLGLAP